MRLIAAYALLAFSCSSFAFDTPQYDRSYEASDDTNFIGIECNQKSRSLVIGYFAAYNLPAKKMDLWNTFHLKTNSKDGRHVETVHELVRTCRIGKEQYTVKIRAVPGNWNLNGRCGGRTYGGASILKNGVKIFDGNFQECESTEIVTTVIVSAGKKMPLVIRETYKN